MDAGPLVALVALVVYVNTVGAALLYDDVHAILENDAVRRGDVARIFTTPSWWGAVTPASMWRPLTTLTFALDYAVHGSAPAGYHLVNVVLHALVALAFFRVMRCYVADDVATFGALLFAVHPVHTEAVASVVGRAELLAALGGFVAWWLFRCADVGGRRRALLEIGGMLAFTAALLAKESAIMLLPLLVVADGLYPPTPRPLRRYVALALVVLLFVGLRVEITGRLTGVIPLVDNPLVALAAGERWLTAMTTVALYAWRLVFPLHLSADYSAWQIAPARHVLDARFLAGLAVITGLAAAAWWARRRHTAIVLALAMIVIPMSLVTNLFVHIPTIMAERLLYLPSAGFCLLVALGWHEIRRPLGPVWSLLVAIVLIVLFGLRTWERNTIWQTPTAFFTAMLRDAPRSTRAHHSFGNLLRDQGRLEEAIAEYDRALAIESRNAIAHYDRGGVLLTMNRPNEAIAAYGHAVELEPTYALAMMNLAAAEFRLGHGPAAASWLRRAIAIEPEAPNLHHNLAHVLTDNDPGEARREFETALRLAPTSPSILSDYAVLLGRMGDHKRATEMLTKSVRLDPTSPEHQYNLGNELVAVGDLDGAVRAYESALQLRPKFPAALENLGNTESLRGNHGRALELLQRAQAAGAANSEQPHERRQ